MEEGLTFMRIDGLIIFSMIPIIMLILNTIALYRLYISNNNEGKGLVIFCFITSVIICIFFLLLLYKLQSS